MKQPVNLFLLLVSLVFFANCNCNNPDVGNGPKDVKEDLGPKFSLALAEGVKQEDLYNSRPIGLVLKDDNFSKHGTTRFKVATKVGDNMGSFHLLDAHGKAGERILDSGSEVDMKNGFLPLLFIPSGKAGKNNIALNVYYQDDWNKVDAALDLKEGNPNFSLALAEGIKQEDLSANRPIGLVLQDENFSKHDSTTFKLHSKLAGGIGALHLLDAHGKAGERIADSDIEVEIKDGSLPLFFVPAGKAGKHTIHLELYYNGSWNKVGTELDLQEGNPKFSLALAEGINPEELSANRPIELVLKDDNFSKHDITIFKFHSKLAGDIGALHLLDAHGKAGERIADSDIEVEIKDSSLPLFFVPAGKAGKHTIHLELYYNGSWNKVSTELDLKSFISLEGPENMKTSKVATAFLKIDASLEEEFTLKSVRIDYYPLEMTYDNGEEEGVWSEVRNVRIGDKFKAGEHELSLKLYGDKDQVGDEIYPGDKSNAGELQPVNEWVDELQQEIPKYWFRPVSLDLVLVDNKGVEYKVKTEFDVEDISFDVELGGIDWGIYNARNSKEFREGIFKFKATVSYANAKIYDQDFKILSFTTNDGSAVSLVDYTLTSLIGKNLKGDAYDLENLYFRFDEINLDFVGKPTILTLKLQGPGGVVKSADLRIEADEREIIFWRKIEWIRHRGTWISQELGSFVRYKRPSFDAQQCGKEAIEFLEQVKFWGTQINPAFLSRYFSPHRLKEIESALKWVKFIKKDLQDLNKEFGFNFVSPI